VSAERFMGEAGAERRRYPRMPLRLRLSYQCLERGSVAPPEKNLAQDLAAGGLAMHCERVLPQGQLLMLQLFLPPAKAGAPDTGTEYHEEESSVVSILSRVAWCAPARKGGFDLGVQFLDMDRDDRQTMKGFLGEYRLFPPDAPLYL
jgi:hypothetical protein